MIPASDLWMLGLRPVRNDEDDAAAVGDVVRPARSTKFVVDQRLGRWRVQLNDEDAGAFASLDDAVRFACGQAREQAKAGTLGVVVVQSEVQEMHCFTPPAGAYVAPPEPKLRVVGGAGR
ncbi:hypothetical protein [Phenylobacterium sp.]|jgi:hypothetical protein|uniref:hypothetical protein n=1 Tax=Phenylobacterium sp. TaxID=1871053 RepID=UPI0012177999|nr:hypothetical protein [Phenylobacterium sp.]THD55047.1 MAG: hypothetical protein E8A12_16490 [Phenylobacterium sp.]